MSPENRKIPDFKTYLGDAVYVRYEDGLVWLTTEDGVRVTNEIGLEEEVYEALVKWIGRLRASIVPWGWQTNAPWQGEPEDN